MHVNLLGPVSVHRYGEPIALPAAKPRGVLALLCWNSGRPVQLNQIVDELWGEQPLATAVRTVQTYVYQLRKALRLGDGRTADDASSALVTRPSGYELRLAPTSVVDADRFRHLLDAGRHAMAQGDPAKALPLLREALSHWHGTPFMDVQVGSVLAPVRVRLEQLHRSALELRIDAEFALGEYGEVLDELHELVSREPAHEGFSTRLMTALQASGRRAEALEVFHSLRRRLNDEFGVVPSPSVQDVFREVLEGKTTAVPKPVKNPVSRPNLPPAPKLFGREREKAALRLALTTENGPPWAMRTVEVVGGPGVGTTAFVQHATHEFGARFRDGAYIVDCADISAANVARLRERLSAADIHLPAAKQLTALSESFGQWSSRRQMLLVADHVSSMETLAALRPSGVGSALIVVNQFGIPGQVGDQLISLRPLQTNALIDLLADVVGVDRVLQEWDAAHQLTERCEGNPLLMHALGRLLTCRKDWSIARIIREMKAAPQRVPVLWSHGRSVRESVLTRVRLVSGDAQRVLSSLQPEGCSWTISMIAARLGWTGERVQSATDELIDADLLQGTDQLRVPRLVAASLVAVEQPGEMRLDERSIAV